VIGFADFQFCSALFAAEAARKRESYQPDKLLTFQYPNFNPAFPGKVRRFAITQPLDQLILRHDAGRIIEKLDSILSDRVCSFRLDGSDRKYLPWAFTNKRRSWRNWCDRSEEVLRGGRYPFAWRTDVRSYYPSVNTEILEKSLSDHSCDASAIRRIIDVLEYWQRFEGLKGLPIGVEASAVLGNVFLESIDRALAEAGANHLRFADDFWIFAENRSIGDALIELFDERLNMVGLERSLPKTQWLDSEEAISSLRKPWLNSLSSVLKSEPEMRGKKELRFAFEQLLEDPSQTDPSEFRFLINALIRQKDDYGCVLLAHSPELMNVDPRASPAYLAIGVRKKQSNRMRVIESCMAELGRTNSAEFHGLHLHLLRAMSLARVGQLEGRQLEGITIDASRPWPIRNFAWQAFGLSSARSDSLLMEAAREEQETNVRRAIVATLKTSKSPKRMLRSFLRHARRKYPESRYTVEWVRQAA
jgi:hypothetical protein